MKALHFLKNVDRLRRLSISIQRYSQDLREMKHDLNLVSSPRWESFAFEKCVTGALITEHNGDIIVPQNPNGLADIFFEDSDFPINIKAVSNKSFPCNLVSPVGALHHMFFNHIGKKMTSDSLARRIFYRDYSKDIRDIGFIIINKDSFDISYTTLLNAREIVVNPSNGFQITKNGISMDHNRTLHDSRDYIIERFVLYLEKRAEPYNNWFNNDCDPPPVELVEEAF